MKTVVVFDKETKEIVACIRSDGTDCIVRNDVDFNIYNETEPIFEEKENSVFLKENAFLINF